MTKNCLGVMACLLTAVSLTVPPAFGQTAPAVSPQATVATNAATNPGNPSTTPVVYFSSPKVAGFDTYQWTMEVQSLGTTPKPYWYWAQQSYFQSTGVFYFGLQPNGQYGKTALFSFFGDGTSSSYPSCATGADTGSGTSCHIAYPWKIGRSYTFTVVKGETSPSAGTTSWSAQVEDSVTGESTTIGVVQVPTTWGLIQPGNLVFSEWFEDDRACDKRTSFNVLFGSPIGYLKGTAYPETVSGTSPGTCVTFLQQSGTSTTAYIGK